MVRSMAHLKWPGWILGRGVWGCKAEGVVVRLEREAGPWSHRALEGILAYRISFKFINGNCVTLAWISFMTLPCFSIFLFRVRTVNHFTKMRWNNILKESNNLQTNTKATLCLSVIILSGCRARSPRIDFQGHLAVKICAPGEASVVLCQARVWYTVHVSSFTDYWCSEWKEKSENGLRIIKWFWF